MAYALLLVGPGKLGILVGEPGRVGYRLVTEAAPSPSGQAHAIRPNQTYSAGRANGGRWARSSVARFMLAKRGSHHAFWN